MDAGDGPRNRDPVVLVAIVGVAARLKAFFRRRRGRGGGRDNQRRQQKTPNKPRSSGHGDRQKGLGCSSSCSSSSSIFFQCNYSA